MVYKCSNCGFIHEGEMPDGYYCPFCRSNHSSFKLIKKDKEVFNRKTIKEDNPSINRIVEKCINCGVCTKTCQDYCNIKDDKVCIKCGARILSCPVGALTP